MSGPDNPRSESRQIQRSRGAPLVQTPDGPAYVQIIDLAPGGTGGPSARAGNPIVAAIAHHWWLVLLVAIVIGGVGVFLANRLVKPVYQADALVLYHAIIPLRPNQAAATDPIIFVQTEMELLTKPEIALQAARSPELQQALPWLRAADLDNPAVQKDVVRRLRGACEATQVKTTELVQIRAENSDGYVAAAIANAFADAFVDHCTTRLLGQDAVRRRKLQEQVDQQDALLKELIKKKNELALEHDLEIQSQQKQSLITQINEYQKFKSEAEIRRIAAEARLATFLKNEGDARALGAELQLARKRRIEEEKTRDSLLQAAIAEQVAAYNVYVGELGAGKTELHRDVVLAKQRLRRAEDAVIARETQIAAAIDAKVIDEQKLTVAGTTEEARDKLNESEAQVKAYERRLAGMDAEARRLAAAQQKMEQVNDAITRVKKQYDELWSQLKGMSSDLQAQPDAVIAVAERADIPLKPTDDKRMKVQAAGVMGGLLIGVLMAMFVDKFDRRLRRPQDIEPLFGAPILGTIPRVQELKRRAGAQAQALLAEEFRVIRTQVLFGEEQAPPRTLCITSPAPGDGKTSLAVNLAMSLAKAGRRVLLVDADLRKPDLHRLFRIDAGPGLAECLAGADLRSAIRPTELPHLEVLPAGDDRSRPAELLSGPQLQPLIDAMAQLYDHVIFDTAPLLAVSDTHVLARRVDAVICAFSAAADSRTVQEMQQTLRRNSANVLGCVVNQVRYRHTGSYQRGRSAYSAYYRHDAESPPADRKASLDDHPPA